MFLHLYHWAPGHTGLVVLANGGGHVFNPSRLQPTFSLGRRSLGEGGFWPPKQDFERSTFSAYGGFGGRWKYRQ